jgi:2-methylcitrate dehydratase
VSTSISPAASRVSDPFQHFLADYGLTLKWESLTDEAIHAAKVRIIDTVGALIGGFFGEPCRMARNLAAASSSAEGATVLGTRIKTSPDLAAFANGTTARYVEMNDVYHWPGSSGGHPSDVIMPILTVAEHAHSNGRDAILAVIMGYEIYLQISHAVKLVGFDSANLCCLGAATAAGRLYCLSPDQMAHAISMAAVSGNILRQVRTGHLSMWKAVAAGQAGRTAVFSALLARQGMSGPALPFTGDKAWFKNVAGKPFLLDTIGGLNTDHFKVQDTHIKPRPSCATTISSILAAEKVAAGLRGRLKDVRRVTVEVYERAKEGMGTGAHLWNPDSRETADHSIPYVVAAAMTDGTITPRQFDDEHLWNPDLRALIQKIEVVANDEFTAAYKKVPVEHHTRVIVDLDDGTRLTGRAGADQGDLSEEKSDTEIAEKFRGLTVPYLGKKTADRVLTRLWELETLEDLGEIPPALVLG